MEIQDNMKKIEEYLEIDSLIVDATNSVEDINLEILNFLGE